MSIYRTFNVECDMLTCEAVEVTGYTNGAEFKTYLVDEGWAEGDSDHGYFTPWHCPEHAIPCMGGEGCTKVFFDNDYPLCFDCEEDAKREASTNA